MNHKVAKDARIYCSQGPEFLVGNTHGSLSGKTFVFKDLFDVQGYVTGAGNPTWLQTHEAAEHTNRLLTDLLEQGAHCVGRVQTDELAYSLNGQNIHYGTPINPIAPDCLPGGSSSGSAVAVANGDADFSIGTDTGGSVRVPASYCGLFGLRPTLGRLDLQHAFQLSGSFDTAGIFSRDLALLKSVFSVLTVSDSDNDGNAANKIYLDSSLANQLTPARIDALNDYCANAGMTLLESDVIACSGYSLDDLSLLFRTIQGYEIIQQHDQWLQQYGESLDPTIMQRVIWSRSISETQYQAAKAKQCEFHAFLSNALNQLDGLWVLPTTPSGPPALTLTGEPLAQYRSQLMSLTSIAGLSGLPQLHFPISGLAEGPCGFSLMATANKETDIIATALQLLPAGAKE
ncbi:amidase [Vibrio sp. 10N.286.49.B3]|uniref:amidase n=1 Tax=Vibrio sp. 10N.286.49.B3 TaxID=1880855 RepID=UPI000C83FB5D|nr:amidase [Vibrio sp. 10N.286.49.B3]PMH44449.1 amidase [Vibrio sp. 10N.286.49.B3]